MFESERELETRLYNYMINKKINPMNGNSILSVVRQLNLGESGIPDLITHERDNQNRHFINVIELKNTKFHHSNISQVTAYMSTIMGAIKFQEVFSVPENQIHIFPQAEMDMFPGAKIIGSILVVGQAELDCHLHGLNGLLHLSNVTVYSLVIEDFELNFVGLADGMPCIGASENLQRSLGKLKNGAR